MSDTEPVIADTQPMWLAVKPGTYEWCSCGLSTEQPFCDGAHQGTEFAPLLIEFTEPHYIGFCMCKRTARPPYCDGAHARLK